MRDSFVNRAVYKKDRFGNTDDQDALADFNKVIGICFNYKIAKNRFME